MTILFAITVWFLLPDSPLSTHFLTPTERAHAILRKKGNHSIIEQKQFERHQFIEAIRDPKTWLFFFHARSWEPANGFINQYSLIIKPFGFTAPQTTLLACVNRLIALASLGTTAIILAKTRNSRAWVSAAAYVPCVVSSVMVLSIPFSERWALIGPIWIRETGGLPCIVVMV